MGPKLDQDPYSVFFHEVQTSKICAIQLINRQINGHGNNTSLAVVKVLIDANPLHHRYPKNNGMALLSDAVILPFSSYNH